MDRDRRVPPLPRGPRSRSARSTARYVTCCRSSVRQPVARAMAEFLDGDPIGGDGLETLGVFVDAARSRPGFPADAPRLGATASGGSR